MRYQLGRRRSISLVAAVCLSWIGLSLGALAQQPSDERSFESILEKQRQATVRAITDYVKTSPQGGRCG